jgi:hypothetical protein
MTRGSHYKEAVSRVQPSSGIIYPEGLCRGDELQARMGSGIASYQAACHRYLSDGHAPCLPRRGAPWA